MSIFMQPLSVRACEQRGHVVGPFNTRSQVQ